MAIPVGLLNYVLNSIFVYKKKVKFFNFSRNKNQEDVSEESKEENPEASETEGRRE